MKKILLIAALAAALTGCTSTTQFGDCIGAGADEDPALRYKVNTWNVIVAILFVETIVVPVVVVLEESYCPVSKK